MRETVKVGDNFKGYKIYEIINECFGKNYTGWMKAWYDINDDFAAWFPTITKTDDRPNGTFGGTKNLSNTLAPDGSSILETDHGWTTEQAIAAENDPKVKKYWKKRLVFGKIKGELVFLGVFEREWLKDEEYNTQLHHRIATGINLKTWETFGSAYRIFICPMAESNETSKYEFVAEFKELKRAAKYAGQMREKKRYKNKDIVIKEIEAPKHDAENGTIERVIATTGEYLILGGQVLY